MKSFCQRRLVRIDRRVLEDLLVDELLRGLVAVGVEDVVRRLGDDFRLHHVVEEVVRLLDMLGIGRDGHLVEPHLRAFLRDRRSRSSTPLLASAARSRAWRMSPDQPSAMQMSPLASALMYSDEWNFRM